MHCRYSTIDFGRLIIVSDWAHRPPTSNTCLPLVARVLCHENIELHQEILGALAQRGDNAREYDQHAQRSADGNDEEIHVERSDGGQRDPRAGRDGEGGHVGCVPEDAGRPAAWQRDREWGTLAGK